jgi:hypothetical protein
MNKEKVLAKPDYSYEKRELEKENNSAGEKENHFLQED